MTRNKVRNCYEVGDTQYTSGPPARSYLKKATLLGRSVKPSFTANSTLVSRLESCRARAVSYTWPSGTWNLTQGIINCQIELQQVVIFDRWRLYCVFPKLCTQILPAHLIMYADTEPPLNIILLHNPLHGDQQQMKEVYSTALYNPVYPGGLGMKNQENYNYCENQRGRKCFLANFTFH